MDKAFVLGAGLGTRLRPLTHVFPKPLIPVYHRPLITYAFDHLLACGMREFVVNTHHLPQRYAEAFPDSTYRGAPLTFRHEPILLETAGGIANIADLVSDAPFVVYNGDILTDLPLAPLLERHQEEGNLVTLVLRSRGPAQHIAVDPGQRRVTDIRGKLGTGNLGTHQFTGIYAVSPEFLQHLEKGKIESVIPIFLKLISAGAPIGAVVADEGQWWDLGDQATYLKAHQEMHRLGAAFPAYAEERAAPPAAISPKARIHPTCQLSGLNVISEGAVAEAESELTDCIVWPGASVDAQSKHQREVLVGPVPVAAQ